jgi:hypothetical protein
MPKISLRERLAYSAFALMVAGCSNREKCQPLTESKTDVAATEPVAGTDESPKTLISISAVQFLGPAGAEMDWELITPDKTEPIVTGRAVQTLPSRLNFPGMGIFQLRISNIPNHPKMELHPTLEIRPHLPRYDAHIAHSVLALQITEQDIAHVAKGNYVYRVVYLPDQAPQEPPVVESKTIVSYELAEGGDPTLEAARRGEPLLILQISPDQLSYALTSQ